MDIFEKPTAPQPQPFVVKVASHPLVTGEFYEHYCDQTRGSSTIGGVSGGSATVGTILMQCWHGVGQVMGERGGGNGGEEVG